MNAIAKAPGASVYLPALGRDEPKQILLCPGPVMLSETVRKAIISVNIGHREPEFSHILKRSAEMLRVIIGADSSYEIAFLTGSGTAANECIIGGVATHGNILVISNGEFGERLLEIASIHNTKVDHLRFEWQESIDLTMLEDKLAKKQYHLLLVVHHETSTGMLNPIAEIAKIARGRGVLVAVDAVSSIGAEVLKVKEWGIDVLVGASGKALSGMPGVGILVLRTEILNSLDACSRGSHYLDLWKHFSFMRKFCQTPNTPAIHAFVAMHTSLQEILGDGLVTFQRTIRARARLTRIVLKSLDLKFSDYGKLTSSVITCVLLPPNISATTLTKRLKENGIVVYNGKGPLKERWFQIGHIGALEKNDVFFFLDQLRCLIHDYRPLQSIPTKKGQRALEEMRSAS